MNDESEATDAQALTFRRPSIGICAHRCTIATDLAPRDPSLGEPLRVVTPGRLRLVLDLPTAMAVTYFSFGPDKTLPFAYEP